MSTLTNQEIVLRLSGQLKQFRISRDLTQEEVADRAGININTLRKLEAGENASLATWIAVLRVFQLENQLLALIPDPSLSPMMALKNKNKKRQRVRKKRST